MTHCVEKSYKPRNVGKDIHYITHIAYFNFKEKYIFSSFQWETEIKVNVLTI